jgi:drug/metabolite transporter (DMT)-like permease
VLVFILGLGSAALSGVGFVVQQRVAAQAPAEHRLSLNILRDVVPNPLWLAGFAAMIGGDAVGAAALAHGNITLVEPLEATSLLFALPFAAAWPGRSLGRREWTGAIILLLGLALFVFASAPEGNNHTAVPTEDWVLSGLAVGAVAALLTWLAKRGDLAEEATLLASAAGLLYGFEDALTRSTLLRFGHGLIAGLTSWQPYTLVAVTIIGLVLTQSAFEAAPLAASLPALTIAEPLAGIALGAGIFSEALRVTALSLSGEAVALIAMVAGVILVARSPLITDRAR